MKDEEIKQVEYLLCQSFCKDILKSKFYTISKNEESTDGNVYIINCENERYVAKIYGEQNLAKTMVKIHTKLIKMNINVPKIIYTDCLNSKQNDDKYIVVFSFIAGTPISSIMQEGKIADEIIIKIAESLRKIHDINYGKNELDLPVLSFDKYRKRKALLHFDLTKDNIFIDENNEIAIIDFDDAKYRFINL